MSSTFQENVDIEALLRGSIAGIPGARLYRDEIDQPEEMGLHSPLEEDSYSEEDDEAQLDKYIGAAWDNVTTPADVDLLNSWRLLENRDISHSASAIVSMTLQEPSMILHKDGLPATHTCKHCEHVVVKPSALRKIQRVRVAKSREELDRAAEDGCLLLTWLRWYLYGCLDNPPSYSSDIFLKFRLERHNDKFLGLVEGEFIDWGANHKGQRGKGDFGPFHVVTPGDDPAAEFVRFRPVNLSVSSDESFAVARKWIHNCHTSHPDCEQSHKRKLPTRVLCVADDSVRLIETNGLEDDRRYAALSYCWGGDQEQKTTIQNVRHRYKDGIKLTELPKALRDAVNVTMQLGLLYLWIDSLCIVQDGEDDKKAEVAKMADIYSGAYVTISAASSRSAREGFLGDRKPSKNRRHVVPIKTLCPDGKAGWIYLYRPEVYQPNEEPLNTRGWTLQEHLLSPRLLIYGSWQLRWVCRTLQASDGGPDNVYPRAFEGVTSKLHSGRTVAHIRQEGIAALDEKRLAKSYHCMQEMYDIVDLWPSLVEAFTRRNLSVATDRPAAIYGIAMQYAELCSDRYAAGLWATNIARQLLWKRPNTYDGHAGRSPGSRPPSWSWISVDGEVTWEFGLARKDPQLTVLSCRTAGNFGPLGAINDIPLTVKGRIRAAFYLKIAPNILLFPHNEDLSKTLHHRSDPTTAETDPDTGIEDLALTATATFDHPDEHTARDGVGIAFLLEVLPFVNDDDKPAGIILDLDLQDGKFRRIGYFDFEWVNAVWSSLYETGSRDHDERRRGFRQGVFGKCPMEEVIIV